MAHNPNLAALVGSSSRQRIIASNDTPPSPDSQQPGEPHSRIKFVWPNPPLRFCQSGGGRGARLGYSVAADLLQQQPGLAI